MFDNAATVSKTWRQVEKLDDVIELIDLGLLLPWAEMRRIKKLLNTRAEYEQILAYIGKRFIERHDNILSVEILSETLLVFLKIIDEKTLVYYFVSEILNQSDHEKCVNALVQAIMKNEIINVENRDEIFSQGIYLLSELGLATLLLQEESQDKIPWTEICLNNIATHLLSLSNENSPHIRLALVRYFGVFNAFPKYRFSFNRILSRFAHTLLEQLFNELFARKNEASALAYLLETLPYVFEADQFAQQIVYYNFRHFFLKQPERFMVFLKELTQYYSDPTIERLAESKHKALAHLVAVFGVANEVDHRTLGRELMTLIVEFMEATQSRDVALEYLSQLPLRKGFSELVTMLRSAKTSNEALKTLSKQSWKKRGRKPSISKISSEENSLAHMCVLGESIGKAS